MARFKHPSGLVIVPGGVPLLYVADALNHAIRSVFTNGSVVTLCGSGSEQYNAVVRLIVHFSVPSGNFVCVYVSCIFLFLVALLRASQSF